MAEGDKQIGRVTADTVVTADATVTQLMVYPIPADTTALLSISVEGQRYDSGESDEVYSYQCDHIFNKAGSNDAVLQASGTPEIVDPQTTGWTVTVDADVSNARVRVMGSGAEDVRWMGAIETLQVEQEVTHPFSALSTTFDGGTEYVTMGNAAPLDFDYSDPFTISGWVKSSAATGYIVSKRADVPTQQGYSLGFNAGLFDFILSSNVSAGTYLRVKTDNTYNDGNWHHVALVYTAATGLAADVTIYVDNVAVAISTIIDALGGNTTSNLASFNLGTRTDGISGFYTGNIDDVAMYDADLSVAEVAAVFALGEPVDNTLLASSGDLVGYWLMGDGAAHPTIPDDSTNSNDGTMVNMDASNFTADVPP